MKKVFVLCMLTAISITASAQTPEILLEKIKTNYTQEKLFLHYDKDAYLAGETIWFKAYIAEGMLPSKQSTVVKAELMNDSGRIVSSAILPVSGSVASGNFELSKTLRSGSYMVRCFTRRMMNFGTDNFYTHFINIYNENVKPASSDEANDAIINFLPEGGNLVGNKKNSIAFICTDKKGVPLDAEGTIKDASGKIQGSFKSMHNGMGKFEFTPVAGEKYTAVCSINGKTNKEVTLPVAQSEGITLRMIRNEGVPYIEVNGSGITNKEIKPAYLLATEENSVAYKVQLDNGAEVRKLIIPESQLVTGILQVTVFNADNKPLAERLVFNNTEDYRADGVFKTDTFNTAARKRNVFSYELPDTMAGTYSVAVTDAESVIPEKGSDNIYSGFLLSGELKGRIFNPDYYFEKNDDQHKADLDLVMLTHGWRRYSWNEILSGIFPSMSFKDPDYAGVSGTAYSEEGMKLKNESLTFSYKTKSNEFDFLTLNTDSAGNFLMNGLLFEDTTRFSLKSGMGKKQNAYLSINSASLRNLFSVAKSQSWVSRYVDPSAQQTARIKKIYGIYKDDNTGGVLLQAVEVKAKLKSVLQEHQEKYMSGMMGGGARHTLDLIANQPKTPGNILEYLRFAIPGVRITGGPIRNYAVNYRAQMSISTGAVPMTIYVDEVQSDADYAATFQASDIAMVSVFSSGPMAGPGGTLAIYTRKGDDRLILNAAKPAAFDVEGFSTAKEFFSPDYDHATQSVISDNRTTLYWNPYLHTASSEKKINFSFYNSDNAKKIKVVLEGILEDGRLVHFEKILE